MKISLGLFIYLLHGINCMENAYLTKYLNDRAKIVGEKLIRHARKKENLYTVKLNNTNIDLIGNYSHGEIFTFFNTPYALVDQDLYEISQNNSTVIHVLRKKDVIFVKTTEFQSLGFVAFATKESLHISGFHKRTQKFFKIQNILTKVTDATFFQNHNNLYLITSNYKTPDLASIIIYKFVQTHFDETVKFEASGASKIHTFPSEQSEIILILHKEGKTSSLYEFHEDKIKTIQKIDTKRPEQVLDYLYEGKRHVLIFGQSGTDLYLWSGIDLLLWDQFTENVGQKTLIFYVKNDPFVLSKNNESFLLFSLSNNKFNLVYKSNFNLNYVNLWSMVMHKNELITLGPTINNSVTINKVTILVQMNNLAENLMEQETTLSDCFLTLEKTVYALRNKLTQNDTLLRAANDGVNKFPGEKFEKLIEKYESVEKSLRNRKSQSLIVDESAILQIPLKTKKLLARKIKFEEIKNEKWQPQKWLLYSKPQNISGPVTAQMLQVTNLNTKQNKLFDDLLLSTGGQKLSGFVTTNNLETSQIATNSINEIPVDEFCYTTRPIRVEGVKTFPELRAKNIHTAAINGIGAKKTVTLLSQQLKYNFAPNVTIGDLWVENLNEIDFENFKNSVFRIGVSDTITGNLTFPNLLSTKVRFGTLSQNQDFLTTSTDQIVNSTITIPKIFTHDVKTARINGANFTNLATLNDTITGPVTIKDLNIRNNLELEGEIETEFLQINNTHIMGTHESDFFQRYDGRVKIQGNLYLRNFELGNSAKILISGEEFEPEMGRFWSKSGQQEIPTHFEAQNGISTPHLTTIFVNNVHVGDYMLNSTQQKKKTKFYFDNVTIRGNVLLNPDEEHSPDLRRIQEEAVIINGTFNIRGRKTYKNVLKVHELELNHLNNVDTISAGPQKIQNLVIKGDLKSENLTTQTLNGVNLTDLIANTVYLDKAQNVPKLNFNNISVDNLFVTSKLNNKNVNELVANLDKINNISKIENVIVSDNVTIKNVENLARINDFSTDKLMSKSHSKYHDGTIFGDVRFLGNVKIRDLQVVVINDVNFEKLSKRVLYKSWNQTIEEHFVFNRLISDNLITDQINEFEVANLIDISSTKSQVIFAPRGLKFAKNTTIQNLFANIGCDLNEGLTNLRNPPSQLWGEIVVNGNATFWDSESLISDIFENVVTTRKNHTIRGKVNFAHHVFANNMTALKNVNNVNISEIIKDAFVNKPNLEQVITGRKIFQKLEAEDVDSLQNTNVSSINELKISEIDAKLIKNALDVPIKGKKVFFGGLQTKKIETGFISGVGAENLVSFVNATQVPNAIFGSVVVLENFNVKFINNMPLDVVLNERFLKKGPKQVLTGNYFLRNVKFTGNVTTPRINDVEMENVVYDDKHIINSLKKFNHFVVLGNVDVELINGFKLSQLYEQAVLINEETNFKKSVYVNKPTFMDGNIETNYINNISVNYMLETSNQNSLNSNTEQIRKIATIVTNFIKTYFNSTIRMPTEVMYLEKSKDLQISLPNVIGAEVVKTKNDVLIHIESEEEGSSCGLPPTCKCPLQQTMQVSSKHSVNMFLNKATQRIYSHYDENIVVHFITHSISTDSYCSTNKNKVMDEISSLTWTVTPYGNNTGGFFIHRGFFNGYITGVKFFTIYGKTYIVVGIYYDPILETHAVDSLVLRFNQDQTKIEKVQRIPTVGLKTISLFPTAQGVVLVMGVDVSGRYNSTNTKIFRFDHHKEQFELLRELPTFDCLFAEGVVLEMDSLIVLANQRSALHILKYHPNFDNYYFYQSFQLDYPVSSLSVFYAEGFGISDAYLSVVTKNNKYFIFSFQFIAGWKVESTGQLDGIKVLVPFTINKKSYILAPSKTSSLLAVVEHDSD
ncbi:uncharacterized protein LOC123006464 [Tribolium madens]|uniref:uncharacterized protein LOC123006464 n=1 Tax=Tribolium madens TaxID=41895 RepID=UPI001CF7664C|nr:uncharacterized protein LOC123006464 [Tribolium madens]